MENIESAIDKVILKHLKDNYDECLRLIKKENTYSNIERFNKAILEDDIKSLVEFREMNEDLFITLLETEFKD